MVISGTHVMSSLCLTYMFVKSLLKFKDVRLLFEFEVILASSGRVIMGSRSSRSWLAASRDAPRDAVSGCGWLCPIVV
ncbi:hypothetical protein ACFLXO_04750 [Chloroflexota bacterium]